VGVDLDYRLADRYDRRSGRVHVNGDQALVRALLERRRRDARQSLATSGYVSGYRGSPLGGFDMELGRAASQLAAADIRFAPGVNEDLAATAIWGTQQSSLLPGHTRDGVFALWYGKGPGVDRSGDALKHGNLAGVARHGGVIAVAGDDPGAKSSSLAHQSEPAFVAAGMPVVYPATLRDVVELGVYAWEMSRLSGCWAGFKVVTELMDSSASIDLAMDDLEIKAPRQQLQAADYIAWSRPALAMEQSLVERRLPMAQEFWRLNRLDRVHHHQGSRIGIAASGRAYLEVREALRRIGADEEALGLRIYQVSLVWPLEPAGAAEFAAGLTDILVVEEKQPLIEDQLARYLYPHASRPRLAGKAGNDGLPLIPAVGELTADLLVPLLVRWLRAVTPQWTPPRPLRDQPAAAAGRGGLTLLSSPRTPGFCAGCPHNLSTTVPDGSMALGGIGCHGMAVGMAERSTLAYSQMGGEGANWVGMAPFVKDEHIFQNLGDGTFYHSGMMAVRAAVAAEANITYKVLANGAIAMTGGQRIEGEPAAGAELVPDIVRQLRALGVGKIVVLNDGTHSYPRRALPADVGVFPRDRLAEVQQGLRTVPGVSAIVFDQFCAAEARRLRKRGTMATPARRMVINERVCEGCGDCNHVSNCIAVEPAETKFGRKRRINQSACNIDLSCAKGYCPSFVTVTGGVLRSGRTADTVADTAADTAADRDELDRCIARLPEPPAPGASQAEADEPGTQADILITGIGGTGISTTGAILGMAAHLEGHDVSVLNQTGLAQKNGPVSSHVRIRPAGRGIFGRRVGAAADVLLAADLLTVADAKLIGLLAADRTRSFVDTAVAPTASLAVRPDLDLSSRPLVAAVEARSLETVALSFKDIATALVGPGTEANIVLTGYALQRGLLGLRRAALERAIELNGVAVEANMRALGLGRLLAAAPQTVDRLLSAVPAKPGPRPARAGEPDAEPDAEPDTGAIAADLAAELVRYQDGKYAQRYLALVHAALDKERELAGSGELAGAVARYFFKVLAYKDEYEVARLYTDGAFAAQLKDEFGSYRAIALNLAPQRFVPKDPRTGRPRKIEIPGRVALPALRLLARAKALRGGPFDIFGKTKHRRRERVLVASYQQMVTDLLRDVTDGTYPIAVELASFPEHIRGYGDVKDASMATAQAAAAELLARFHEQRDLESSR
jgi:indolepyruvate ferredoxin oxidoreductase